MQPVCVSSFSLSTSLKLTLLQLDVSSFHHTYFTIVNRTWRLCQNAAQTFLWCWRKKKTSAFPCHCVYRLIPLSLPFTKLSHSRNHCMLMHRITVGASSAWNSLFSCRWDHRLMRFSFNTKHYGLIPADYICQPWWKYLFPSFYV